MEMHHCEHDNEVSTDGIDNPKGKTAKKKPPGLQSENWPTVRGFRDLCQASFYLF
jgi:hypothetical protein